MFLELFSNLLNLHVLERISLILFIIKVLSLFVKELKLFNILLFWLSFFYFFLDIFKGSASLCLNFKAEVDNKFYLIKASIYSSFSLFVQGLLEIALQIYEDPESLQDVV